MTTAWKRQVPEIPVLVEVDPALAAAAELAVPALVLELTELLERVGLTGRPEPRVERVESVRAVQVRVHGVIQPYDPRLARQVWLAVAEGPLREAAVRFDSTPREGARDRWLRAAIGDAADTATLSAFVCRLVVEIVERRAQCLVGPAQVAAYATAGDPPIRSSSPGEPLQDVLRCLLGLGVWPASRETVVRLVQEGAGREAADIAETLLARLRPRRIEIHTSPGTLATLLSQSTSRSSSIAVYAGIVPADIRADFRETEEFVYLDFGLRLPDFFWVPSEQIRDETVAVRINDIVGVELPLPPEGMLMVNAVASSLGGVDADPALGPAGPSALIREEDAEAVQVQGYTTFDRLAFIQYLVLAEVRRNATRLLSVRDVEFELDRIEEPDLVRAVLERWSLGDITRVLRQLLDGGLSMRDMRTVLERLLQFDTIDADADRMAVFDDRLPVSGPLPTTPRARARVLARFVREGMAGFIGSRFAFGSDRIVVYLLDPQFEELALVAAPDDLEGEIDRREMEATLGLLRNAVWDELSHLPLAAATPVLLTSRRARTAVRRVIETELPDLRVIRHSEIPPDLNVMPMARIALAPEAAMRRLAGSPDAG